jgi:hypothetical protein
MIVDGVRQLRRCTACSSERATITPYYLAGYRMFALSPLLVVDRSRTAAACGMLGTWQAVVRFAEDYL